MSYYRDQIHFSKWNGHFSCGVTHPRAVIGLSRMQPKQQTLSSSPLEIFVVGSLAANLPALTFRSGRRGKPVLPPLCAWPLQQLLLQKDSPSDGMSFRWRLGCPVASGAFASAVAGALCAVGTVARIALIWHQSRTEMDYLLLVGSMQQAADYSSPKGWAGVIWAPSAYCDSIRSSCACLVCRHWENLWAQESHILNILSKYLLTVQVCMLLEVSPVVI